MPTKSSANPNFSISLIIVAAVAAALFTLAAGGLLYQSTNRLISSAHWVEHTQDVITSLQSSTQFVERIESSSRLFLSTKDEDQFNAARAGVLRLEVTAAHFKGQIADNPSQFENAVQLEQCAASLTKALDNLTSSKILPRDQIFRCRQTINLASEQEKKLLSERTEASRAEASLSLTTDLAFAGISLVSLCLLFAFLLRDAFQRRTITHNAIEINQELASSVEALESRARESQLLTAVRDELQLCVGLEQVYVCAARSIAHLLPGSLGSLCMIDNSRHLVEAVSRWGDTIAPNPLPEIFTPNSCCGLRSGALRWRRPGLSEIHCTHFAPQQLPESYLCVPIAAHGETLGILFVQAPSEAVAALIQARLEGLRQIIQLIGMSIAALQLRLKLEHQSIRDPLTGLFNRHFMQVTLEKEMARSKRNQKGLAVLMLDVDHFKTFNDRFGHAAGDSVLKSVATVLQNGICTEDYVCRYGGEEFVIILPEVSIQAAIERAEDIRKTVSDLEDVSSRSGSTPITISIGIAFCPSDTSDPNQIIQKADQALYRAKNGGRNQVVLYDSLALHLLADLPLESLPVPA